MSTLLVLRSDMPQSPRDSLFFAIGAFLVCHDLLRACCSNTDKVCSFSLTHTLVCFPAYFVSFFCSSGVVPFCAHSISYNLAPLTYMAPYGLGVGLTVRMGTLLASATPTSILSSTTLQRQDDMARRAKIVATTTLSLSALVGLTEAFILYQCESIVIPLFTSDPAVVETLESIWFAVCLYIFVTHMFAIHDAILRALGMQWRSAMALTLVLWCVGLPVIATFILADKMEISGLWYLLVLFNVLIQLFMFASYIGADWTRTGQASQEPRPKWQMDFWTKATSSFITGGGSRSMMTEQYQSAYEEAKGTIRHRAASFGTPRNGTYASVYYAQGGSERITFFSAIQLVFETVHDLHDNTVECSENGDTADSMEVVPIGEDHHRRACCWKITGHGNDSDGSFVVSEGFVVATGEAYWIEESTQNNSYTTAKNNENFPYYCYPTSRKTTSRALILNRGVFDFTDNSFTGSWISNAVGAVERPHHPEFRLQQTFGLAQQDAIQNILVLRRQPHVDMEPSPPVQLARISEGDDSTLATHVEGGKAGRSNTILQSSSLPSLSFPVFRLPPASGLYRCSYLDKGVSVRSTIRLSFEPYHHEQEEEEQQNIVCRSKDGKEEHGKDAGENTSPVHTTDSTGTNSRSHNNLGLHDQEGMLWRISGSGTNSLGTTFTIVEGLASAKFGTAYWVEKEQSPHVDLDHHSSSSSSCSAAAITVGATSLSLQSAKQTTACTGLGVLSTGTFSFVTQDFVGWRQSSNDSPSCRYQEFYLLQEERQHQGRENQPQGQHSATTYDIAYEQAKSRVEEDVAGLVCSPSVSGYYYDHSCTPTSGTYTYRSHNPYDRSDHNNTNATEPTKTQLVSSTVCLQFKANVNNSNIKNECDEEIGYDDDMYDQCNGVGGSRRSWTITGAGKNFSDGSHFAITEGVVSASGKAYWVETSSPATASATLPSSPANRQRHVVCTGDFVFAPLSHEVEFRGGWCDMNGQRRWFNQFRLSSHWLVPEQEQQQGQDC